MNVGSSSECSTEQGDCLSCIYLNARSILPKRFDLLAYICCHKVDILAVTETFLDSSISNAPASYLLFHRDRSGHGGGVLIFVRDSLQVTPHNDLSSFCDELPLAGSLYLFWTCFLWSFFIIHQIRVLITLWL